MKIRPYQPADERAYLNTVALAYMHSQFRDQISDQRDAFGEADGYRTVISLVATMDGLVVGAIDAGVFNDDRVKHDLYVQHQGRGSYIEVFAVSPSAQGQGLGRALIKACLAKLKTAGADFVEIFTRSDAAANGLYQSLGAREIAHNWRALATPKSYQAPKAKWALDAGTQELVLTAAAGRVEALPQYPQWVTFFTEAAMADYTIAESYRERTYLLKL